jgi:hypothetical protein
MPRTLAALAALTLAACNPTSEEACLEAAAVDGTLAVGVGEQTFAAVADGDTVPLVLGSQGGLMVLGALRVTGIVQGALLFGDADNPLVDFQLLAPDGAVLGGYTGISRHFVRGADDVLTLVGETLVLGVYSPDTGTVGDTGDGGDPLAGDVTLSARIGDACGRELTASRTVRLE